MMNYILIIGLVLSFSINVFLIWYLIQVLRKLLFVSNNIGDLQEDAEGFVTHIESVYGMETFYGDETLQNLLEHAKAFSNNIKEFEDIYTLTEEEATVDEDEFDDEEEEEDEEE